jgi:anti-sigma B factor antagonist
MSKVLELEGELTIVTATETGERLGAFLNGDVPHEIGLSGVTDFDTAGLQLLFSLQASAAELGTTVTFVDPSPPVTAVLSMAQLDAQLKPVALEIA